MVDKLVMPHEEAQTSPPFFSTNSPQHHFHAWLSDAVEVGESTDVFHGKSQRPIILATLFHDRSIISPSTAIFLGGVSILIYGITHFVPSKIYRLLWLLSFILILLSFIVFLTFLLMDKLFPT